MSLTQLAFALTLPDIIVWLLVAAYGVLTVALIAAVLSENRNPLKALSWVMALVLFPVGGMVLYLVFGRSLRNVKMISRRNRRRLLNSASRPSMPRLDKSVGDENRRRIHLGVSVAESPAYGGNSVSLFNGGGAMFEALIDDLRRATGYIYMQFYIIANDELGNRVADVLIERARAGVKVRVIYDYVGSWGGGSQQLFRRMREGGVRVHSFFRIQFPEKMSRLNWRNHRKVVVIDGHTGYIGGMNVARRYLDGGEAFGVWRDLMARVTGPVVSVMQQNFAIDWKFMGHDLLTDEPEGTPRTVDELPAFNDVVAQVIASGPASRWGVSHMVFLKAISGARRRVYVQTPYFLPSEGLVAAMQCAALSGVDVRLMVPRRSDSRVLMHASNSYMEECLLAGIKVYMYRPGMLHSKMLLVDEDYVTLGSTNFDYRSFEHNFEANIVLYSREVNACVATMFHADQKECTQLRLAEWNRRPHLVKARESLCRLMSPIL